MSMVAQRRRERRLRYHWPIWFAEPWDRDCVLQGQIVDLSSEAAAFTCSTDNHGPYFNQQFVTRFCVPIYGEDASLEVRDYIRAAHVQRIDGINDHLKRVVIRFHESLGFKPGEQKGEIQEVSQNLEPALL